MGVYIDLVETINGRSRIIKTGKYGLNGCELIFDEANHIGNGLFKVSGEEAIANFQKVMVEISEKTNEYSDKRRLQAFCSQLSSLGLRKNAVYSADFGEYFFCEQENKDYDPACLITEQKQYLEDALCGYCEFGNYRQDSDIFLENLIKEMPGIKYALCVSHDKDCLAFSVHIECSEEDKKEFRRTHQSLGDYFVAGHNKRRLFYILKNAGLDEFTLLDRGSEWFHVVASRDALQKWLEKRQDKALGGLATREREDTLAEKISAAEGQKQPALAKPIFVGLEEMSK